jgi:membrane protease YdiL (CAAX protease family)
MADDQGNNNAERAASLFCSLLASEDIDEGLKALPEFEMVQKLVKIQHGLELSTNLSWLSQASPLWTESLSAIKIQDLLLQIWLHGSSGYLLCKNAERMKVLHFSKGEFHSARSNLQAEQIINVFLEENILTKEQIVRAQAQAKALSKPFFAVLLAQEDIDVVDLFGAVNKNLMATMAEVLSWESGEGLFYARDELEDVELPLQVTLLDLARHREQERLCDQSFLLRQIELDLLSKKNYLELSQDVDDLFVTLNDKEVEVLKAIGPGLRGKELLEKAPEESSQERDQFFFAYAVLKSLYLVHDVEALSKRKIQFLAEEFSDAEVNEMYDDILGVAKRDEILQNAVDEKDVPGTEARASNKEEARSAQVYFTMRMLSMAFGGLLLCIVQSNFMGDMIYAGADVSFQVRRILLFVFGLVGVLMCTGRTMDKAWPTFKGLGWKGNPLSVLLAIGLGAGCSRYTFNAYAVDDPWYAIVWVPVVVVSEEVFFRGYLFMMFERLMGSAVAACFFVAVCNSLYFLSFGFVTEQDLMRQLFRLGVSFITLSLPVCLCYLKTRSLLVSSGFHAALRFVVLSRNF